MEKYKIAFSAIIIVILIFTLAYTIVITRNIYTSPSFGIFNWNPPPSENGIPISMNYPDTIGIQYPGTSININFNLTFTGELAENTPIQVKTASCALVTTNFTSERAIGLIIVAFHEAIPEIAKNDPFRQVGGTYTAVFSPPTSNSNFTFFNVQAENTLYFPVSGDYSPTIIIDFNNGSAPIQQEYSEIQVTVLSASVVNAENLNRINLGLTYALVGFSIIGGIAIIYELLKEETDQFPITIMINPEINKSTPIKKEPKIISLEVEPNSEEKVPNIENSENNSTSEPKNNKASPT